jgi:5-methylthioadenosine/S-adenosylhomocysteine deaminase
MSNNPFVMKRTSLIFIMLLLIFDYYLYGQESNVYDILLQNATILTINKSNDILKKTNLGIKNKKIDYLGTDTNVIAKKYINCENKIVLPGFINTHTHVPMSIFKGIADDVPLDVWLNDYIWPLESKYINKKTVYLASLAGIAEMLHSGITTFNDMYFFEDEVAKAASQASIRAVVSETLMDAPTVNVKNAEDGLAYSEWLIKKWQGNELIKVGIAPHAPYTASRDLLIKAKELANKYGVIYHIHLSETQKEYDDIKREFNLTPVSYLDSIGVLDKMTVAAHVIYLDKNDFPILKRTGISVSHNPESNMKLASGISPVYGMLNYGINISLGTDSVASNNNLDFFDTMDIASKLQKVYYMNPLAFSALDVVRAATIGGAKALHLDEYIGTVEIGKNADIVILNVDNIQALPIYNPFLILCIL